MTPLNELGATGLATRLARGEITAEALVRDCLERVGLREPAVRAFARLEPERVLEAARALDERSRRVFGRSLRLRSVVAGSCGGCEAELVALGIERVPGAAARLRTVPRVAPVTEVAAPAVPPEGAPYAELADLEQCAGLALGSPARFGNMAAPLKHFLDGSGALWQRGALAGKPACVFTSSGSLHSGPAATLGSMMRQRLQQGKLRLGMP